MRPLNKLGKYTKNTYHLYQNYYITSPYFWTIHFGSRDVKITSQKASWTINFGRRMDLSDMRRATSGEWGISGRINFWRRNVICASQKSKTNPFRNSFGTEHLPERPRISEEENQGNKNNKEEKNRRVFGPVRCPTMEPFVNILGSKTLHFSWAFPDGDFFWKLYRGH